jgi:hypothetical protein
VKRQKLPATALAKLIELNDVAEHLSEKLVRTEEGIASARSRLTGGFRKQGDWDDTRAALDKMVQDLPGLKRRCDTAQSTYATCRAFLDGLPDDATLETVEVSTDGHDLADVRAKREAAQAELATLRALPTASADIEARIRAYVEAMARPQISGIGKGERFRVVWAGAGFGPSGPREDRADILPMMAFLHPDAMIAALTREVERMANDPLPQAERKKRVAALEHEIEQLAYVEEALAAAAIARGEDVQRSPSAPPQAVLQVRVAEATKSSRAA